MFLLPDYSHIPYDVSMNRQKEYRALVHECLARAESLYGVDFGRVTILFDIRGSKAAEAGYRPHPELGRTYFMRFNRAALDADWESMTESTIPHEVAHLVAYADPTLRAHDHNWKWRNIAITLGDAERGKVYHTIDLPPARRPRPRHLYQNAAGSRIVVAARDHLAIQSRARRLECVQNRCVFEPRDYIGLA